MANDVRIALIDPDSGDELAVLPSSPHKAERGFPRTAYVQVPWRMSYFVKVDGDPDATHASIEVVGGLMDVLKHRPFRLKCSLLDNEITHVRVRTYGGPHGVLRDEWAASFSLIFTN